MDNAHEPLLKSIAWAGPLYATSIAISYDVGYFYGVGPSYFTFFSIAEHLVFALQVLPLALLPAAILIGVAYHGWLGYQRGSTPLPEKIFKGSTGKKWGWFALDVGIEIVQWGIVVGFGYYGFYSAAYLMAVCAIVMHFVFPIDRLQFRLVRAAFVVLIVSTGWIISFLVGIDCL